MPTQFTLCEEYGYQAKDGACPIHSGDACLKVYVHPREVADDRLRTAGWAASFAYEAYMREPLNDALGDDLDRQMDRLRKALEKAT